MGTRATVTSKGQITLPKEIRDRLSLKPGDVVEFVEREGETIVEPRNLRAIDLVDFLGPPPSGPKSLEEIEEGIAEAWAEHGMRGLR